MPPIMGAGAFLLAELTETPYFDIVKIAVIPAILYYLSVGLIVYFRAMRDRLHGVPVEELPRWVGYCAAPASAVADTGDGVLPVDRRFALPGRGQDDSADHDAQVGRLAGIYSDVEVEDVLEALCGHFRDRGRPCLLLRYEDRGTVLLVRCGLCGYRFR